MIGNLNIPFDTCVYSCDEPEFVGRMPIRSDITVLSADDCNKANIGWTVEECVEGSELYLPGSDSPITKKNGLRVGMTVLIWDSMLVTIRKLKGNWYWEIKNSFGTLEYSKDSRKCWAAPCILTKKFAKPEEFFQCRWQDLYDRAIYLLKKEY